MLLVVRVCRYFVLNMRDKELRRYKTRPSVAAKSTAFSLSTVEKVTEAVEQPAVEDGEGSPVPKAAAGASPAGGSPGGKKEAGGARAGGAPDAGSSRSQ